MFGWDCGVSHVPGSIFDMQDSCGAGMDASIIAALHMRTSASAPANPPARFASFYMRSQGLIKFDH